MQYLIWKDYSMENTIFFRMEVLLLLSSFAYILYYTVERVWNVYFKVKNIVTPQEKMQKAFQVNKIKIEKKSIIDKEWLNKKRLSDNEKQQLIEIIKRAKLNATKWYFDTAKNLIVEGLTIDKYNRDLNLILAWIYEKEKNYSNAVYIYKDLVECLEDNSEIMKKLWFVYALQNEFTHALKIYEKIHKKKPWDIEVINMIADLTYDLKDYKKSLKFIKLFLHDTPRNVEKMFMSACCLENTWELDEASKIYKKILELQPYNTDARDKVIALTRKK